MKQPVILLGLNELNFEYISTYIKKGYLPSFSYLFKTFGYKETTSESEYRLLEPWIQWVTIHTGKTYEEHKVFRLGDIVGRGDLGQLWEKAEQEGLSVGAISPFNVENRLKSPSFFVPDPWTQTPASGEAHVRQVAHAVSQVVNDNANGKVSAKSVLAILKTYLKVVSPATYGEYIQMAVRLKSHVGTKAVILDKLLGDLFLQQWKKYQPDFSSLFLNTGAHVQHHYMFNSLAYEGSHKNPEWYCPENQDPLLIILKEYDKLLARLLKFDARLIVATGLHQKPHKDVTFYWRLNKHEDFLKMLGVNKMTKVIPRMSRDFLIELEDEQAALDCMHLLQSLKADTDGINIFTIDNRGNSLFVELTYPNDIPEGFGVSGQSRIENFKSNITFVAIKNGEHHGLGYVIDTEPNDLPDKFPLTKLHPHIAGAF